MRIGCLGWGSLVWDPRGLPIRGDWFEDGPLLPIEFARVSSDLRVTLVLVEKTPVVRSLWTLMDLPDLLSARTALAGREGVPEDRIARDIGVWSAEERFEGPGVAAIVSWAERLELDGVVWTALPPGFRQSRGTVPEIEQVLAHLRSLEGAPLRRAEEYVRRAPRQTDTPFRRRFERELGWTRVGGQSTAGRPGAPSSR